MNNFIDFIYRHFPHRWLNHKAEGTKRLFEGLGNSVDYAGQYVTLLQRNNSVQTVEELITELENEYGLTVNPSYNLSFRRERIIARMRIQDSPVTMNDLTKMLEALGLHQCTLQNDYNNHIMEVRFNSQEEKTYEVREAMKLLDENIRAHIEFFMKAIISGQVGNSFLISFYQLKTNIYVKNLKLEYYLLNGQKLLDGSWVLQSCTRTLCFHELLLKTYIRNLDSYPIVLNGEKLLDGKWKLDVKGKRLYAKLNIMFAKRNQLNSFAKEHFLFSTSIINLSMDYVMLNSRRRLDGGWFLHSVRKGIKFATFHVAMQLKEVPIQTKAAVSYLARQENVHAIGAAFMESGFFVNQSFHFICFKMIGKTHQAEGCKTQGTFTVQRKKKERKGYVILYCQGNVKDKMEQLATIAFGAIANDKRGAANVKGYLTTDTMWYMDGVESLDGKKKLNAAVQKVIL